MVTDKYQERLAALFGEIERLADIPAAPGDCPEPVVQVLPIQEATIPVKSNGAVHAPEAPRESAQQQDNPSNARPILFEKQNVGFAYEDGQLERLNGDGLPALDAQKALRSEITDIGKPIGGVYVEPPAQREWTEEETWLADEVAQRASLQIQNLRLLEAAERARAEAQAANRRFTHESWETFLDAIHQKERIGYAYDQGNVVPCDEAAAEDGGIQESVDVLSEQVGLLTLKTNPDQPLSADDRALVAAVAHQVGQQVENLRLLADASRARAEAEEATRRLTQEGWKKFARQQGENTIGFVYDRNQVIELGEAVWPQEETIVEPLKVRGEIIGQLAVSGLREVLPEVPGLVAAIAAQASIHLETLRLTEELQKRAAELQELDRLKSSFLANMSHELRTPLNSILGFSDVMLEGIDGELTEYMENDLRLIQKNGKILLHLINDVLDMAKIESGRMNLHPEKFKVQRLIEEVINITSTLANAKNLALFIDNESDQNVDVVADEARIRQVLMNLVNNAIKFTESGQIAVRVYPAEQDHIKITIKDTGMGIPADHLEAIFQEFSQVDTSTTRKVGGTGLGLPISRRLVEMHGGRLWVESKGVAGEGSTFIIDLPCVAVINETVEKSAN